MRHTEIEAELDMIREDARAVQGRRGRMDEAGNAILKRLTKAQAVVEPDMDDLSELERILVRYYYFHAWDIDRIAREFGQEEKDVKRAIERAVIRMEKHQLEREKVEAMLP